MFWIPASAGMTDLGTFYNVINHLEYKIIFSATTGIQQIAKEA